MTSSKLPPSGIFIEEGERRRSYWKTTFLTNCVLDYATEEVGILWHFSSAAILPRIVVPISLHISAKVSVCPGIVWLYRVLLLLQRTIRTPIYAKNLPQILWYSSGTTIRCDWEYDKNVAFCCPCDRDLCSIEDRGRARGSSQ